MDDNDDDLKCKESNSSNIDTQNLNWYKEIKNMFNEMRPLIENYTKSRFKEEHVNAHCDQRIYKNEHDIYKCQ